METPIDTTETSFRSSLLWIIFLLTGYLGVLSAYSDLYGVASSQIVVSFGDWRSTFETVPGQGYMPLWVFIVDFGIKLAPIVIVLLLYVFGSMWIVRRHKLVDLEESFPEKALLIRNTIRNSGFKEHVKVYASDDDRLNCFTFGSGDRLGIVFTRGLLETLEDDEVSAAASHELGHILNRDVWIVTLASSFVDAYKYYILVFFGYEAWNIVWLASGWVAHMRWYNALIEALLRYAPDFFILIPTFVIPLLLVNSLSRYREILADATSTVLVGSPFPLNSALMKIYSSHYAGPGIPSRLAIAGRRTTSTKNPLVFLVNLFRTHPTLGRRQKLLLDSVYGWRGSGLPSGEAVSWFGLTLAFVILALLAETVSVVNLIFARPYIFLASRLQGWVSAYHLGIELVMPVTVIVGLFYHYSRRTRSSLLEVWKKIVSASLVYSLFFTALVMLLYLTEEFLGHIMMTRFTSARAEYIDWIFEYVRVIFPRLDLFIFTRSELYMTPALPMIGCILVGTFTLAITTSLFMLLTMTRRMLGLSLEPIRKLQRSVSRRNITATFMVILLIGSCYLILTVSTKSRRDLSIQWLMSSFHITSVYEDSKFNKLGYFEPDDLETNFCAVKVLERLGRLGELTNDPDIAVAFSKFPSRLQTEDGGFRYSNFPDSRQSVECGFYAVSILNAIHRMDAIDKDRALRYALRIPLNESVSSSYYALSSLGILGDIEETDKSQVKRFLASSQYLNIRIPLELKYYGGFGEEPDSPAKLSSTYFALTTLRLVQTLNQTDFDIIGNWTMKHYANNGGFSEDLNFYTTVIEEDRTFSNVLESADATLEGTFYSVKILEALNILHLIDGEKTASYILEFQRRTGGFSSRPLSDEATMKDMYMAIEVLASLGRLHLLEESFPLTTTLHNLLQDVPLLPVAIILGVAVALIMRKYLKKIQ